MEWLIFIVAFAFGAITMIGGNRRSYLRLRADRDKWRRKAGKTMMMAEWLTVHKHSPCPHGGTGKYASCDGKMKCSECWLKAAAEAVKEDGRD